MNPNIAAANHLGSVESQKSALIEFSDFLQRTLTYRGLVVCLDREQCEVRRNLARIS